MVDVQPVCALGATLGEGPVWLPEDAAVWFVDKRGLYRFDSTTGAFAHLSEVEPALPGNRLTEKTPARRP